jgi:hypothetical protein
MYPTITLFPPAFHMASIERDFHFAGIVGTLAGAGPMLMPQNQPVRDGA